ncbi:YncE family protein [Methylobacterium marchantiae]|uniref:YncE family protein n=1 Tax=Methylobacterium marchantiae TaxID=600331 RepID=A0ABW3WVW3_9HYPH|nr:Virginiamycin B lyase [Methylobacterium marchantiae]
MSPTRPILLAGLAFVLSIPAVEAGPVYVASQGAGALTRIEAGAGVVAASVAVGQGIAQVAAGPDGRLYLTQPDHAGIDVVDGRTNAVLRRLPFQGQAFGIVASADGASLFVGDWAGGRLVRVSAGTGAVEGSCAVGRDPAGLVLDRKGRLYVADRESRQVSVIDTARMERLATVPVGEGPFALGLNPRQDRLYVANVRSGDLSVIETGTMAVIATVKVGGMPYGVATSADGGLVLVTNQQAGTVVVIDAASLDLKATIPVGRYPEGIAVDGVSAYVANWFSDSVSVIDLRSLTETARIPVAEGPRSLVVGAVSEAVR